MSEKKDQAPKRQLIYTIKSKVSGEVLGHYRAPNRQRAFNAGADQLLDIDLTDQETLLQLRPEDVRNVTQDEEQQTLPLVDELTAMTTALLERGFNVTSKIVGNWTDEERDEIDAYLSALQRPDLSPGPPNFLEIYDQGSR